MMNIQTYQNKNKPKNTQTNKEKTKQNVKIKAKIIIHTLTFRGIVNVEKIYCVFFSTDATHTYDIILDI
jgi:Fic family protein